MIRFNYIKISELLDKHVSKAYLYIKILHKSKHVKLHIKELHIMWCSFGTTWLNKPISVNDNTSIDIIDDYLRIDVTKYITCFSEKKDVNHLGFILKVKEGKIVLVTADSYYYQNKNQLFYCNSRYYSPELCRWISPDSIEYLDPESINGLNLYRYASNNPIEIAYRGFRVGVNKVVPNNNSLFNVIAPTFNKIPANNSSFSLKPLTLSIGLVTSDNPNLPKWIDFSAYFGTKLNEYISIDGKAYVGRGYLLIFQTA